MMNSVELAKRKKKEKDEEDESCFKNQQPSAMYNDDWGRIIADHKTKYPEKYPEQSVGKPTLSLSFPTTEDGIQFFKDQALAEPPRKFRVIETDDNGKSTGLMLFSCGNKKLYYGSRSDIIKQLEADLVNNPDDMNIRHSLNESSGSAKPVMTSAPSTDTPPVQASLMSTQEQQAQTETEGQTAKPSIESSLTDPLSLKPG